MYIKGKVHPRRVHEGSEDREDLNRGGWSASHLQQLYRREDKYIFITKI
jgi:hypothetical protein